VTADATTDAANQRPPLPRRVAVVLIPTYALVVLSFALPDIPLDGQLAEIVVRVADTGTWTQLPILCVIMVAVLVSRVGISGRRRALEAGVIIGVMLVSLAGNALLNEHVIKESLGVPRPNISALAEAGALGPEYPDGDAFYATNPSKDARREALAPKLEQLDEPALAELVEAHWLHETGYSFPSGHATAAMTFASLMVALGLAWVGGWRLFVTRALVPIWALAVVYSRPLLEVHTPVDVSVGGLIGFGWGLASAWVVVRIVEKVSLRGQEPLAGRS
jgi:membrane-associated phospholipid phosphatase